MESWVIIVGFCCCNSSPPCGCTVCDQYPIIMDDLLLQINPPWILNESSISECILKYDGNINFPQWNICMDWTNSNPNDYNHTTSGVNFGFFLSCGQGQSTLFRWSYNQSPNCGFNFPSGVILTNPTHYQTNPVQLTFENDNRTFTLTSSTFYNKNPDICALFNIYACDVTEQNINCLGPRPSSGTTVAITSSGGYSTQGVTNINGNILLDIKNPGYFNIDINGPDGSISKKNQYLTCSGYYYLIPPCYQQYLPDVGSLSFTYSPTCYAVSLAAVDGVKPYQFTTYTTSLVCGIGYCLPDGVTPCSCGTPFCSTAGYNCGVLCTGQVTGPCPGPIMYAVVNNTSVKFKVGTSHPYADQSSAYWSDVKLLWATVTYYPSGYYACKGSSVGCDVDSAVVDFSYVVLLYNCPDPNQFPTCSCGPTVMNAYISDLQPPNSMDCGIQGEFGECYGPPNGFCGDNALDAAMQFCSNLPDTLQYGEQGSFGDPYTAKPFPNDYFSNPSACLGGRVTINCPKVTYTNISHGCGACSGSPIYVDSLG